MGTGVPPDTDIQVALPEISILGFPNDYIELPEHLLFIPSLIYDLLSITMPKQIYDNFKSVLDHSNIKQLSKTTFIFMHPDVLEKPTTTLVHAATITDSITFNQLLCVNPDCIPKWTPLGYDIFATTFNTGYSGPESFSYFCEYIDKVLIKGKPITYDLFSLKPNRFNIVPNDHELQLFEDLICLTAAQKVANQHKPGASWKPYEDTHTNSTAGPSKPRINKHMSASPAATQVKKRESLPKLITSGISMLIYENTNVTMGMDVIMNMGMDLANPAVSVEDNTKRI